MEAKQLELFSKSDFMGQKKTYIKKNQNWYLFDNVKNRTDFSNKADNRYVLTISNNNKKVYDENSAESRVCYGDINSHNISMDEYFEVSDILFNSEYSFNKKIGKLVPKIG